MKKIAFLISIMLLPLFAGAQKSPIDKLFDKYYGKKGFTSVLVNKEMFEVITKMEQLKGELEGVLGNINRVRIIAQEDESVRTDGINFMKELRDLELDDYRELVVVKEAEQEVLILAKEEGGKLAELLVLVGGEDNALVSIEGKFTMQDLEALSDLEGLDVLDGLMN